MKKFLLLLNLFLFAFSIAQETEQVFDFSKIENQSEPVTLQVKTPEGKKFYYKAGRKVYSTHEIHEVFGIPDTIAAKYPFQVVFLKEFTEMDFISADNIIGVPLFQSIRTDKAFILSK